MPHHATSHPSSTSPSTLPYQPNPAPPPFRSPIALPSYHPNPTHTTAVRRGASWTAAYRRQLTAAAVARPVHGGVGAPGVLAAERSWWLLAQTTSARRSVQPVSSARALSPWSTRPAGTPRRRSPVSSRRCPPIRSRRPGSGCPAVRCPVTRGWSSRGSGGRTAAVQLSVVQLSGVHPCGVQPSGVCPRRSGRVRLLPLRRWRGGPGQGGRATLATLTGGGPVAAGPSTARSTVAEAETRAPLPKSRWSRGAGGDPGRRVGCGPRRPRLPAERPGRPGRCAGRPSRAAARWARGAGGSARWRHRPRG
jgi:hypothetical protein